MLLKLLEKFAHVIFPPYCEWCRSLLIDNVDLLCLVCQKMIKPVVAQKIHITPRDCIWVYSVGVYQDPLKYLIISKRWSYRLASYYLGDLMWRHGSVSMLNVDYITAVPLHWTRQAWRGYNQAEIMAQRLAALSGKKYIQTVSRTSRTPFQSLYAGREREDNVKKVFSLKPEIKDILKGKHILIVDDLMTSGSTLKYVARELLKAHPDKLSAVVVARVT